MINCFGDSKLQIHSSLHAVLMHLMENKSRKNIFTLSASNDISSVLTKIDGKSLIKVINKRGPKWEPCGTPELTEK